MPLIIIFIAFIALKYFEVGPFANLSWWWAAALFALAYIWFEFIEKIFGLERRKADDITENMRKERVSKKFEKKRK